MSAQHTPGPWIMALTGETMQGYSQSFCVAEYGKANLVAGVFSDVRGGQATAEANARLIAAAPDLLAAAVAVLDYMFLPEALDSTRHGNEAFGIRFSDLRKLRAAVARATQLGDGA